MQPEGRRRWPIVVIAAAALAAIVGGLVIVNGHEDTGQVQATNPPS